MLGVDWHALEPYRILRRSWGSAQPPAMVYLNFRVFSENPGASADDRRFYREMEAAVVSEAIGVVALSRQDAAFISLNLSAVNSSRPIRVRSATRVELGDALSSKRSVPSAPKPPDASR